MCKTLVTYRSNTGATSYYAWVIASELGADRAEWEDDMDLSGYDLVIYGGGVYAGDINGLREARGRIREQKVPNFVIFATGGTPNAVGKTIECVWDRNLRGDDYSFPHFYMQSGILYRELPFPQRVRMYLAALMMKSQVYDENSVPFYMTRSYSIADPQYADGLIKYVKTHYA